MATLSYTAELTVVTCWCGMRHAVPTELNNHQQRAHDNGQHVESIYCPLGHGHVPSGKGKAQIQRERADAAELDAANAREEIRMLRADLNTAKNMATKASKRAAAGVCPCCKRSFIQLARHMAGQHPKYVK